MRTFRWIMLLVVALCVLPLFCSLLADLIATLAGCDFNLGASHACAVGTLDIESALYVLAMQGYALFFTVPVLILVLVLWVIVELLVHLVRARHAATVASKPNTKR